MRSSTTFHDEILLGSGLHEAPSEVAELVSWRNDAGGGDNVPASALMPPNPDKAYRGTGAGFLQLVARLIVGFD